MLNGRAFGGIATHVLSLSRALCREVGLDVRLCLIGDGPVATAANEQGLATEVVEPTGRLGLALVGRLTALFRQTRPQVVHCHGYRAGVTGRAAARLARVPFVVSTFHGRAERVSDLRSLKLRLYCWLDMLSSAAHDDVTVVVSKAMRDHVWRPWPCCGPTVIVPNWVDAGALVPTATPGEARARLGLAVDRPVIGMFGRLVPVKRFDLALEAAAQVLARRPGTQFAITGEGAQAPLLKKMADELGIAEAVSFLGFRTDVAQIMNCVDIVLAPSDFEAGGIAVMEAMALSKPVVATAVGALPDVMVPGETGLLVPRGDAQAIAQALVLLIDHPELGRSLGASGRKRAMTAMTLDHAVQRHTGLYAGLLRGHGRGVSATPKQELEGAAQ